MPTQILEWSESHAILDIAEIVRREGHRLYKTSKTGDGIYQSVLCGITGSFDQSGEVIAIKAHDLDIVVDVKEAEIESDDGIERNSRVKKTIATQYRKGNGFVLAVWYKHLCAYRRAMRPIRDVIVTSA